MQGLPFEVTQVFKQTVQAVERDGYTIVVNQGGTSSSKCLTPCTRIRMYDLSLKMAKDIVLGDKVLGIDGTPRTVIQLFSGQDEMYEIQQGKGINYTVNKEHLLVLKYTAKPHNRKHNNGRVRHTDYTYNQEYIIPVKEFVKFKKSKQNCFVGVKSTGIDFSEIDVPLSGYMIGSWLGDGMSCSPTIISMDQEIIDCVYEVAKQFGLSVTEQQKKGKANMFRISGKRGKPNPVTQILRDLGILNNKRIPMSYIRNSYEVRRQVLAGLIDTDGYLANYHKDKKCCSYCISQKSEPLIDDIMLLARTLGCQVSKTKKSSKYTKNGVRVECGFHFLLSITPPSHKTIPSRLARKQLDERTSKPNFVPTQSRITAVPKGKGDYVGFQLDGDMKFFLEDFTITHNTYSILQYLLLIAVRERATITVVGQDLPNLKLGALRDTKTIINSAIDFFKPLIESFNKTESTYTFVNGSILEFKSYQDSQSSRSGKRDYLFLNEANGIQKDIYEELAVRTTKVIHLDYNAGAECWIHSDVIPQKNCIRIISNFTNNRFITDNVKAKILAYKLKNKNRWRVFGLGLTGVAEGAIFPDINWIKPEEFPKDIALDNLHFIIDYGYASDPLALIKVGTYKGEVYARGLLYRTGLRLSQLVAYLHKYGAFNYPIIMDHSTAQEQADILNDDHGFYIIPAVRHAGSIQTGIDILHDHVINIVANKHWMKEQRKYVWAYRKGVPLNKPIVGHDHFWDALRYFGLGVLAEPEQEQWEEEVFNI